MPAVYSHGHDTSGEHLVQFYENVAFLIDGISEHIGSAIAAGDVEIIIATKPHLSSLEEKLSQRGLLTPTQTGNSRYISIEADRMLPLFMVSGMPDETRFTQVIGGIIADAAHRNEGKIRVFGEMVAILCGQERSVLPRRNYALPTSQYFFIQAVPRPRKLTNCSGGNGLLA